MRYNKQLVAAISLLIIFTGICLHAISIKASELEYSNETYDCSSEFVTITQISKHNFVDDVYPQSKFLNVAKSYTSEKYSEDDSQVETTQSELTTEQTTSNILGKYYELSEYEIKTFSKLVYLESGNTSIECQRAVASVVLNRMTSGNMSLHDVIYAPGQFSVASQVEYSTYSEESKSAVLYVIDNGPTIPEYVTFFRSGHYFDWGDRYSNYTNIDNVYFSYSVDLKNKLS